MPEWNEFACEAAECAAQAPDDMVVTDAAADASALQDVPYPGTPLRIGSTGYNVALMQQHLNAISKAFYPGIGTLVVDGIFGSKTEATVMRYQAVKGLAIDGVIGYNTWNAIMADYARIPDPSSDVYPGTPLKQGSIGPDVAKMERYLNNVAVLYTAINTETVDGVFGTNMSNAVRRFQKQFGLAPDSVIGEQTWNRIVEADHGLALSTPLEVVTPYPGYPVSQGASGDSVRFIQSYMNRVGAKTGEWTPVTVDGNFGPLTKQMVMYFQALYSLKIDGVVGSITWPVMVDAFNSYLT